MMTSLLDYIADTLGDALELTNPHLRTTEELEIVVAEMQAILGRAERALADLSHIANHPPDHMEVENPSPSPP